MSDSSRTAAPARLALIAATLVAASALSGCAAVLLGGAAVGGAMVYTDRRTSGTQVEDEGIELKSYGRLKEALGDRGHINVTSYNRLVLLSGEVASEADRTRAETTVRGVDNVNAVVNELAVMGDSSLTSRSSDLILTSKVKGAFVDAKDVQANTIKVVAERGIVYLMGRLTEREATRAAEVARSVGGVLKVVRVFEVITEAELQGLQPK
jgi:osmotically-inducible protein OsmY